MSKRFKREKADSILFHHGLIRLIVVHHVSLHGDSWKDFIFRNGFDDIDPAQIDKPVINEAKVRPPVPFHVLLPSPKPSVDPDIDLPDAITEKAEAIKNPVSKKVKGTPTVDGKGKKNARLISRLDRNKTKPTTK
jgi:hypothetical protein